MACVLPNMVQSFSVCKFKSIEILQKKYYFAHNEMIHKTPNIKIKILLK